MECKTKLKKIILISIVILTVTISQREETLAQTDTGHTGKVDMSLFWKKTKEHVTNAEAQNGDFYKELGNPGQESD